MKPHLLTALLLLVFSGTLCGQSNILNQKIKIESRKGSMGSILDEVSRKGGFYFSYNQDINRNQMVSLSQKRQTVQGSDELFEGNIYCVAIENKLLIKLKPELPDFYTVRGKVIDSEKLIPLPGVTVIIPGSEPNLIGAVSDDSGRFQINVPYGMDAIRFSCIGYESQNLAPWEECKEP